MVHSAEHVIPYPFGSLLISLMLAGLYGSCLAKSVSPELNRESKRRLLAESRLLLGRSGATDLVSCCHEVVC